MGTFLKLAGLSLLFGIATTGWAAPEAKYLTLAKISPIKVQIGKTGEIKIQATVDKGMHIQANPPGAPNLIATTLDIPTKDGVQTGKPVYPAGKPHVVTGIGNVPTYDGTFELKVPVTVATDAKTGDVKLEGKLRYQACNEKTCFFPMTLPVSVTVTVK